MKEKKLSIPHRDDLHSSNKEEIERGKWIHQLRADFKAKSRLNIKVMKLVEHQYYKRL